MKGRKRGIPSYVSDQFVAEIGHELGNVLNGLLGMARLVRESGLSAEQDRWLKAIEQSGRQLRCLVDTFRQGPARPGDGTRYCPAPLDGVDLLEQLLLAHAPSARARANRLWLAVSPELPRRWVSDALLLRQLLDNLLGNALKYTRSGEVVLKAEALADDPGRRGALVLVVTDSGPGIQPELGERMFRAYERGPASPRDESSGCGLGLFICQRIVQTLGGVIEWSTPAGGGAQFTVTLPGVLAEAPTRPAFQPSRSLQAVECRLELQGAARRSVACCLARLGVAESTLEELSDCASDETTGGSTPRRNLTPIAVFFSEMPIESGLSSASLLLRVESPDGRVLGGKRLDQPVLESSLGPLLLELVLECLWLRHAAPDSGS